MSDGIIIFGVLASIVFHELTQISPGGIIVPGYIALLLDELVRVVDHRPQPADLGRRPPAFRAHHPVRRRWPAVFIIIIVALRHRADHRQVYLPVTAAMVIGYLVPGILGARD